MPLLDLFARNLIAIAILFSLTLLIGKRLISQLNFFDFIVGITIGSIAASLSIDRRIPFSHGILSLLIWSLVPVIMSKIALVNIPVRRLLDGKHVVVIENGKILEERLHQQNYNVNDLLEELRLGGVFNITDVQTAVLETNGRISVQLKAPRQPVTPADLGISVDQPGLRANVIINGKILPDQLQLINFDQSWLMGEMLKRNISSVEEIFLAAADAQGNLYIDTKHDNN